MRELVLIEHQDAAMSRITLVDWCFGNICNYHCSYCPSNLHDGSVGWEHVTVMVRFCDRLVSHYRGMGNTLWFQFSGGEPTIYPGFLDLIEQLHSLGCKAGLISNGSRSLNWWRKALGLVDSVSLTHHIEFVNLDQFIRVAQLLSTRIRTHVNVTMLPERFDDCLANAFKIATRCSDITLTLKPLLVDFGPAMYPYDERQKQILRDTRFDIRTTRASAGPRGSMRRIYSDGSSDITKASHLIVNNENRWTGWSCNAGLELLSITHSGNVYRGLCKQGGRIGNIRDEHIDFPRNPVICQRPVCHCATDIMTTRISPAELATIQERHNVQISV